MLARVVGPRVVGLLKLAPKGSGESVLKYRSIRFKLLFYFVAVILLPLLTLGILSPLISAKTIETETTNHVRQLIRQVTRNIEFYVQEMEGIVSMLADDPNIQSFFGLEDAGAPFSDARAAGVRRLLHTVSSVHPEIAGILLVNEHDGALSNEIQPVTRDPLRQEPWYLSAIQSPSTVQLHPRPIGRNLRMDYIYREASICPSVPCSPCPRWSPPASWRSLISVRSW
jgi:two-component system sensor histidine kinase YesM